MKEHLERIFPLLRDVAYEITSPAQPDYNCIAWAAGDDSRWWEPDEAQFFYWPESVPREYSTEAYADAFRHLGFEECQDARLEEGWEKVAIFSTEDGLPAHAARQLLDGRWTSNLGKLEDIVHPALIDIMRERWTAVDAFQRTRGALRFLASCLHSLKKNGGAQPLLGPGDVPLRDVDVRVKMLKELGVQNDYDPVITSDIDGPNARAKRIDERMARETPALASVKPAMRIATSILLYSFGGLRREGSEDDETLPPGVTESELLAACVGPDLDNITATAVLSELRTCCLYLHYDGVRYCFKKDPNVTKLIEDAEQGVAREDTRARTNGPVRGKIKEMLDSGFLMVTSAVPEAPPVPTTGTTGEGSEVPPTRPEPPTPPTRPGAGGTTTGTGTDRLKRISLVFTATRDQVFKAFRAIANLADKSDGDKVKIRIEGTAADGYDPSWLRNAVEEPLDEADIERLPDDGTGKE